MKSAWCICGEVHVPTKACLKLQKRYEKQHNTMYLGPPETMGGRLVDILSDCLTLVHKQKEVLLEAQLKGALTLLADRKMYILSSEDFERLHK